MAGEVIRAENLSKKFSKSLKHVMTYGATDIFMNVLGIRSVSDKLRSGEFWAVDDVSFSVERGKILGLIGPNGSGKTTILKMLNGIYMPDRGRISVSGKVGALIQVGAGFHPMLTGRENIYVNGSILGMSKREIDRKFSDIVDFAGIGDFLDAPVKHYSSGMFVRLGFSIAAHCDPEILLVDEVLAVGDARFYKKCTNKIREITAMNTTIVLVSHNMWLIQNMCDEVILLRGGKIIKRGDPSECIYEYSRSSDEHDLSTGTMGNKDAQVIVDHIEITRQDGSAADTFDPSEPVSVRVRYFSGKKGLKGVFLLRVTTPDGFPLYSNYSDEVELSKGDKEARADIPAISLLEGEYRLWIGFCSDNREREVFSAEQIKLCVRSGEDYPSPKFGVFYNKLDWHFL